MARSRFYRTTPQLSMPNTFSALSINSSANADTMRSRNLTTRALYTTISILGSRDFHGGTLWRLCHLPNELLELICSYEYSPPPPSPAPIQPSQDPAKNPAIPHPYKCFLKHLPSELFRQIIAQSLPARDVIIKCSCGNRHSTKDPKRKPLHTSASGLMTLCRAMKDDIKEVLYAERTFAIHVHQGFEEGGIEILDAGRQPLHYMQNSSDDRFDRFAAKSEFGFQQLKKLEITIFPSEEHFRSKVTTVNTYYTNLALVRLLEREDGEKGKNRMTAITIIFAEPDATALAQRQAGRRSIMNGENYWWDPDRGEPRSTAIYNLSDIELVLRPFAHITGVHNVSIRLPTKARQHQQTTNFVADLIASMQSNKGLPTLDQKFWLQEQMEAVREDVEAFAFDKRFGKNHRSLGNMTAEDALDLDTADSFSDGSPSSKRSSQSDIGATKKRRRIARTTNDQVIELDDDDDTETSVKNDLFIPDWVADGSADKEDVFNAQTALYEDLAGRVYAGKGQRLSRSSTPYPDSITGMLHAARRKYRDSFWTPQPQKLEDREPREYDSLFQKLKTTRATPRQEMLQGDAEDSSFSSMSSATKASYSNDFSPLSDESLPQRQPAASAELQGFVNSLQDFTMSRDPSSLPRSTNRDSLEPDANILIPRRNIRSSRYRGIFREPSGNDSEMVDRAEEEEGQHENSNRTYSLPTTRAWASDGPLPRPAADDLDDGGIDEVFEGSGPSDMTPSFRITGKDSRRRKVFRPQRN